MDPQVLWQICWVPLEIHCHYPWQPHTCNLPVSKTNLHARLASWTCSLLGHKEGVSGEQNFNTPVSNQSIVRPKVSLTALMFRSWRFNCVIILIVLFLIFSSLLRILLRSLESTSFGYSTCAAPTHTYINALPSILCSNPGSGSDSFQKSTTESGSWDLAVVLPTVVENLVRATDHKIRQDHMCNWLKLFLSSLCPI